MKIIILVTTFLTHFAYAATVITQSSDSGASYVDTLQNVARVNLSSDMQNPDVTMDGGTCGTLRMVPTVVNGETINKPEVDASRHCKVAAFRGCNTNNDVALYVEYSEEKQQDVVTEKPTPNCLAVRKKEVLDNPEYCKDDEAPIAIFSLQHKQTCSDNKTCQKTATATTSTKNFPIPVEKVKECSPNDQNLVIINSQGGPSMMASLNENEHCGKRFEAKVLDLGKVIKPLANKPNFQINVDSNNGFRVGNHTQFFFNEKQKHWCVRYCEPNDLKRDNVPVCNHNYENKRETCSDVLNDVTLPMAWSNFHKQHKTAVKLQVVDGKPVATIGHATADSKERHIAPKLDNDQPVVKITLSDNESSGRRSTFEVKDNNNADSPVKTRIEISPTYTLGSLTGSIDKKCDSKTCLNSDWISPTDALSCKKNEKTPIDLANLPQEMCYSCNGLTPGRCGTQTVLLTKLGKKEKTPTGDKRAFRKYTDVYREIRSCGGENFTPTTTPTTAQ